MNWGNMDRKSNSDSYQRWMIEKADKGKDANQYVVRKDEGRTF